MHPKGYTQEMIKEILGTAWLDKDNLPESGNVMRRRKGNEMRARGEKKKFPSKESRIADTSGMFDDDGQYVYPPNSGFNFAERIDPNSPWKVKVS